LYSFCQVISVQILPIFHKKKCQSLKKHYSQNLYSKADNFHWAKTLGLVEDRECIWDTFCFLVFFVGYRSPCESKVDKSV